jgi:hypothetical protein
VKKSNFFDVFISHFVSILSKCIHEDNIESWIEIFVSTERKLMDVWIVFLQVVWDQLVSFVVTFWHIPLF